MAETLSQLCYCTSLPDTRIAVALDDDDDVDYEAHATYYPTERVAFSRAPREDSLGAKYNRAQRLIPADLYVLWADDMVMPTPGWDAELAKAASTLPDNCGAVLFGEVPGVLQPGLAVTQKLIDEMGFLNQPFTPFWFGETWVLEIVTMAGCAAKASVKVQLLQDMEGKSRGVRDVLFWGGWFDSTRPSRRTVAESIIRSSSRPDNEKAQLLTSIDEWERRWLQSNAVLRDPARAKHLEEFYSYDNDATPRYLRLKAQAEKMMEEMHG